jgi:hypothetical protein
MAMRGIVADNNVEGHLTALLRVWQSEEWREVWENLRLSVHTFAEWELDRNTPDDVLWRECQAREVILITANRNDDGPTSLEAVIRTSSSSVSLPVFTFADATRVLADRAYTTRVAIALLQYFMDIENYRGTGRLYVP